MSDERPPRPMTIDELLAKHLPGVPIWVSTDLAPDEWYLTSGDSIARLRPDGTIGQLDGAEKERVRRWILRDRKEGKTR